MANGDRAFVEEGLARLEAHAHWLLHERDPDGDGLLTILLPDESGLDDSPNYDAVFGPLAHRKPGYARLVRRCRRARWSAAAIARTTDEHVEDVLVDVAHALSLRALHRMSGDEQWARHATRTEQALLERCWNPRRGAGANDDADRLASAVAAAAERSGFREYSHPRTGSGHGEHRFGWSTLLLDLPAGFSAPPAGVAKPT